MPTRSTTSVANATLRIEVPAEDALHDREDDEERQRGDRRGDSFFEERHQRRTSRAVRALDDLRAAICMDRTTPWPCVPPPAPISFCTVVSIHSSFAE